VFRELFDDVRIIALTGKIAMGFGIWSRRTKISGSLYSGQKIQYIVVERSRIFHVAHMTHIRHGNGTRTSDSKL
jgi:hypothetical protein